MPSFRLNPSTSPGNGERRLRASSAYPVLLYDQVVVVSGGSQAFRSEAFTNNLGRPIDLRSMRVLIQTATGAAAGIIGGGIIALEIEIDDQKVTRSAVPVWHLCRSDNRLNESFGGGITEYAWYFAHPAPLNKKMKVQAKHLGVISQNATVSVAFAGAVATGPTPRRIPYASYWESQTFGYTEVGSASAPPAGLVNDTGRDLHVERIIGRAIAYDDSSGGGNEYTDFGDISTQGLNGFTIRMGLSQQRPILKTYTQWRAVFGQNGAIETDFVLPPGDFVTVDLKHAASTAVATPFAFSQNKGSVGIVGWREV